jgi:hypothetical protein
MNTFPWWEVTKMKLDKATELRVRQLAASDGMQHPAQLDQKIYMTRRQYYAACVDAFDQGARSVPTGITRWRLMLPWVSSVVTMAAMSLLYWLTR